jgi:hypothetical protein
MAAGLFRVLRTLDTSDGPMVLASDPVDRETAMARFDELVSWRMDRVRVVREQDYQSGRSS